MVDLASIDKGLKVLEPSCGEGVFLKALQSKGYKNLSAYEIDKELGKEFSFIQYESFVSAAIEEHYDLIIGNPPYIRWKNLESELKEELSGNSLWQKYFNNLCDYLYIFILKSIELLAENGQLIFICPEYWMNTTHALPLRNYMVAHGYFEKIYHLNETPVFNGVAVSIIIFKYIKSTTKKPTIEVVKYLKGRTLDIHSLYKPQQNSTNILTFETPQFEEDKRWILADIHKITAIESFENSCRKVEDNPIQDLQNNATIYSTIGGICEIGNGMVSGLDKAFQLDKDQLLNSEEENHTLQVIKAKHLAPFRYTAITKYVFVNEVASEQLLQTNFPNFYKKLLKERERLELRYQYNKQIPYWHWVFLRNYALFNANKPRIFVPCKERISNKNHFRFAYVPAGIFPTQDVTAIFPKSSTKESIYYILSFLNQPQVFNWLKHKGIVKGNIVEFSEKPLSSIPFREIDWSNTQEVLLHQEIIDLTKQYLAQTKDTLGHIQQLFDRLLGINRRIPI